MACPNCDHTMQSVSEWVWWCPRCGSIKDPNGTTKPKLVGKVVRFIELLEPDKADDELSLAVLKYLGVTESIALPGNRR